MQSKWAILPALLVVLALLVTIAAALEQEDHQESGRPVLQKLRQRLSFSVPKLMAFDNFKRQFNKHYASLAEELNRKLLFMPRALRAFVSSVKYRFGQSSSFKRVNDMSDWTRAEIGQLENQLGALEASELEADDANLRHNKLERRKRSPVAKLAQTPTEVTPPQPLVWHKIRQLDVVQLAQGQVPNERLTSDLARMKADPSYTPPDEVFVDHRKSGCLAEVRHQGKCGCCYAFSIVAIMEHYLCLQNEGKLTLLSEQYLVDCAKGRYSNRLRGCNGGMVSAAGNFVHDFGLELLVRYPFQGAEAPLCPYKLDGLGEVAAIKNPARSYLRMELGDAVHIHQDHWERVLELGGPLMVHAAIYDGMIEYGGGIDEVAQCRPRPSHEMVLVGHGVEGGRHYWLVRNSYGREWGEQGYWRVEKQAATRCMGRYGEAFGTRDGLTFTARAERRSSGAGK